MNMETIKKLADNAIVQMENYPVITGKEKIKRMIKKNFMGQRMAPVDRFSWPNALLGESLLEVFETNWDRVYLDAVVRYLEQWKKQGMHIFYVDNLMNGSLALWIEELISDKAAVLYKDSEKQQIQAMCREISEACAEWARKAKKTEEGVLGYRTQHPNWIFADTVGMICPFLCRYGAQNKDEALLNLGIQQIQSYLKHGMDKRTGLPYHGYDEVTQVKYGIIGWGRACGWIMKGMAESIRWIPSKMREKRQIKLAFWNLKDSTAKYQRRDGGFSWQVQAMDGPVDVSAGAMIGNAIWTISQRGETRQDTLKILDQLSDSFLISVTGGEVHNCSGECHGFAQYPQVYGSYPWGTGSVLRYLALKERLEAELKLGAAASEESVDEVLIGEKTVKENGENELVKVTKTKNKSGKGDKAKKDENVDNSTMERKKTEKRKDKNEKSENKVRGNLNFSENKGGNVESEDRSCQNAEQTGELKKKPRHRKKKKPAEKIEGVQETGSSSEPASENDKKQPQVEE